MKKHKMTKYVGAILLLFATLCAAQANLAPVPHQTFLDSSGNPCSGCSLYSYLAGTTTPTPTYTDNTKTSQHTNPIILGTDGGSNLWLDAAITYKMVLIENGVTQWTVDQIAGSLNSSTVCLVSGCVFTGPISGTSASFSGQVSAGDFSSACQSVLAAGTDCITQSPFNAYPVQPVQAFTNGTFGAGTSGTITSCWGISAGNLVFIQNAGSGGNTNYQGVVSSCVGTTLTLTTSTTTSVPTGTQVAFYGQTVTSGSNASGTTALNVLSSATFAAGEGVYIPGAGSVSAVGGTVAYSSGGSGSGTGTCLAMATNGGGQGALAQIAVSSGTISGNLTIENPGYGYTSVPTQWMVGTNDEPSFSCSGTITTTGGTLVAGSYIGTVQSVGSGTITISPATSSTVTNGTSVWHDETVAFQTFINLGIEGSNLTGFLPNGVYFINGHLQNIVNPAGLIESVSAAVLFPDVIGYSVPGNTQYTFEGNAFPSYNALPTSGAVISSSIPQGAVFGGADTTTPFTNSWAAFRNINFWSTYSNPGMTMVDAKNLLALQIEDSTCSTGVSAASESNPANVAGSCFLYPNLSNNLLNVATHLTTSQFYLGARFTEHTTVTTYFGPSDTVAAQFDNPPGSSVQGNPVIVNNLWCQNCTTLIKGGNYPTPIQLNGVGYESSGVWLNDPNNELRGVINIGESGTTAQSCALTTSGSVRTGAANLQVNQIGCPYRPTVKNLVPDSDVKVFSSSNVPSYWTLGSNFTLSPKTGYKGTAEIVSSSANTGSNVFTFSNAFNLICGQTYVLSGYIDATNASSGSGAWAVYDSATHNTTQYAVVFGIAGQAGVYQSNSFTVTQGSCTPGAKVSVSVLADTFAATLTGNLRFSAPMVAQTTNPEQYVTNNSDDETGTSLFPSQPASDTTSSKAATQLSVATMLGAPPCIGCTTANSGKFTTLQATTNATATQYLNSQSVTFALQAGAGSTASLGGTSGCFTGVTCTPSFGWLVYTPSGSGIATGDQVKVTWSTAWTHNAGCLFQQWDGQANLSATIFIQDGGNFATTSFYIDAPGTAPTTGHQYIIIYHCE